MTILSRVHPTRASTARQAVFCLGTFRLAVNGVAVDGWRSGKAIALFRYLVNHRNRPIPRETLIQALWPNPDALAAGTSLKVAVHTLRRMVGQLHGGDSSLTIESLDSSYQLNAPDLWLDVEEFERCYKMGRRLDAQACVPEALSQYARAAELYEGDFLEESWEDWVVFRREGLKDKYLYVLARLADEAMAAGDYQDCIALCQEILEKDNCREDTYRTLLMCHARLGQRGRVRGWYELCVRTLRAQLNVDPEQETELLFRRCIGGDIREHTLGASRAPSCPMSPDLTS